MFETELKFRIPSGRSDAVLRAVATPAAQRVRLQAVYFDTPDFALARARMALRLRKEGRVWVQTLKAGGGLMGRLEHEVTLTAAALEPALDIARHDGTPAGAALRAVLAQAAPLGALYRTDVQRTLRLVRVPGGTVEIACDRGHLIAGVGAAQRRAVIDELEFELKRGDAAALVTLAARWAQRYGLWWDLRSKAEMGLRLATATPGGPAVRARPATVTADAAPAAAFAQTLQAALAQALPNAGELADGTGGAEHLHQLRVALRRLRGALRLLAPWSADAEAALALERDWRGPFAQLGEMRDADVVERCFGDALRAAGAPGLPQGAAPGGPAPAELVRSEAFTALLMRTLQLSLQPAPDMPPVALPLAARERLRAAWRQARPGIDGFAQADEAARHRLRRQLKRLRDTLDAVAPVWPAKAVRRHARALGAAVDALGRLSDIAAARMRCAQALDSEPAAAFAAGWLAAEQPHAVAAAAQALAALRATPRSWQG